MKPLVSPKKILLALFVLTAIAMLTLGSSDLFAQGTVFTYQGHLRDAGSAGTGNYDLRFSLYDAAVAGNGVGTVATNSSVPVSNGLFSVSLDFGTVFNGAERWMEIGVRPAGSGGDFTTLVPRQPLTAAPYAIYAGTAATVPNGSITAAKLAANSAAANLQAGGLSPVAGGGVVLSAQADATELLTAGYLKIGQANLVEESWRPRAPGPAGLPPQFARRRHSAVWTGTEMIIWGGSDANGTYLNTGARYNPTAGTWTPTTTSNAPAARAGHRAVWTGSEMIIWSGVAVAPVVGGLAMTNTGARYHPATDSWTPIAQGGGGRQDYSVYWTGSEMLIWGGTYFSSGFFGTSVSPRNDGARYNLAANSWTALPSSGAPSAREEYSAIFTGTDMIVWGGRGVLGDFFGTRTNFNDGARYNLAANSWTPMSMAAAPVRRFGHSAIWTGAEMIVWGGRFEEGFLEMVTSNFNNGARYNPAANTWSSTLPATGAPGARYRHDVAWAGNRMVVWGGTDGTNLFNSGGRYLPSANAWSNMTSAGLPSARTGHTTVWTGRDWIVWGGHHEFLRDLGGHYNATTDVWVATAPTGERGARRDASVVWTGREVLVWGGFDGERYLNTGGRYLPISNLWVPIPINGAPAARAGHTAIWTGTEMVIWGGANTTALNSGSRFNPATGTWASISTNGAPSARVGHSAVWSGTQMIVWGGLDGTLTNTGGRYNPVANTWAGLAAAGAPSGRSGHAAVWTGTEMIIWGGAGGTVVTPTLPANGARYNPVGNSWAALPNANAPEGRYRAGAVWTGEEMLIWGGDDLASGVNTGGRYNRAANQWSPITTNGAPSPRKEHTVVWDGTRLIVWGGLNGSDYLGTGGLYDPRTDLWATTLAPPVTTNAPPARSGHHAVWTGTEMFLNGGFQRNLFQETAGYFQDTWLYSPPRTMFLYLRP